MKIPPDNTISNETDLNSPVMTNPPLTSNPQDSSTQKVVPNETKADNTIETVIQNFSSLPSRTAIPSTTRKMGINSTLISPVHTKVTLNQKLKIIEDRFVDLTSNSLNTKNWLSLHFLFKLFLLV